MDDTPQTLEQLISDIFEAYNQFYKDEDIAVVATEVTLNDLFCSVDSDEPPEPS